MENISRAEGTNFKCYRIFGGHDYGDWSSFSKNVRERFCKREGCNHRDSDWKIETGASKK